MRYCDVEELPPENPEADELDLLNDAQTHSIGQTAYLMVCDYKRDIAVGLIDNHNARVREQERPWWQIFR